VSNALWIVAAALLGPAKGLLIGPEAAWGAAFEIGRLALPPVAAVGAAVAGAAILLTADRLGRSAGGKTWARPADPWRAADLAGVVGVYIAAHVAGLVVDVFVIDRVAPFGDAIPRPIVLCDAVGAATAAAAYVVGVAARRGTTARDLLGPLGPATPCLAAAGLAAFVGLGLILVAVAAVVPALAGVVLPPLGVPAGPPAALGLLLVIEGLIGPVAEEVVFRPFVYVLLLRVMPASAAVGATGVLFGLLHGIGPATAPRAAGGIVMTWLYARSGSILPGLVVHAGFNIGLRLLPALA
jgi:membrane protease YdiL (CAAX protease family)